MSRIELVLGALLFVSMIFNIGIFWYARAAISRLLSVADELRDLQEMVDSFAHHLETVYELESFYGDQTLKSLLHHASSFNEQLETFEHIYTLVEEGDDDEQQTQNEPS
jgi:hypothetical protein